MIEIGRVELLLVVFSAFCVGCQVGVVFMAILVSLAERKLRK